MQIIKECDGIHIVLRTDSYARTLEHLNMLFEEARKDFPTLKLRDVQVEHYGGERYAGTYGIMFVNPHGNEYPPGYSRIRELEKLS